MFSASGGETGRELAADPDLPRTVPAQGIHIGIHHQLQQVQEPGLRLLARLPFRLATTANQRIHLARPIIERINLPMLIPIQLDVAKGRL